jgi:predicted nucleotidyltransferase
MNQKIKNELNLITKKILENVKADKIILFGSFAYGRPKATSDIDLCIITDENNKKLDIMRKIRKVMLAETKQTHSLDILVYKNLEFTERAENLESIEKIIKDKGVYLYE